MSPEEIRTLRERLALSAGELAEAVGVDVTTVLRWEDGELFPTLRHARRLGELAAGAAAGVRVAPIPSLAPLADPRLWAVVRKLVAHPALLTEVERLAEAYEDPA